MQFTNPTSKAFANMGSLMLTVLLLASAIGVVQGAPSCEYCNEKVKRDNNLSPRVCWYVYPILAQEPGDASRGFMC
ncbi:hypothetical protein Tdes44962_MAKER04593 [Teratosphaeria destructans]|uniref:Uncharacterized protein n=1 Tax=Teratosphaeria destructans TaxID=418781 RepID=A0A9W7VZQ9_9PEZI|nr:hypothetical protein Tdes44962_MAKER04593 [Teratosphaeria destructans]